MATAEEGNTTTSSSYGKFRKKPFRRQTTPYDRPDNNSRSWLKKLVVEPASKLISYGAHRFFASARRSLPPPPPPPHPPEAKADASDGVQGTVLNFKSHDGAKERSGGDYSQPVNSSSSNSISELEQLLKQRTFTRSEVVHLKELLQSRAVEASLGDAGQRNEETASDFARHQQFASGVLAENIYGGIISSAVMSTPIVNSKVFEDDNASPAEVAKAYMGSRPSKVSPSVLGMRSRAGREDTGLPTYLPSATESPILSLTKKASISKAAPENGFITPRSRGRSAIYNMARSPYSKVHLTSNLKGSGINSNGFVGPSMSSSFLSPVESDEKIDSRPMTLKRRSSVLDVELGSVGPIRRIRQKPNLLASRTHHTTHEVGTGYHAKQKLPLIGEPSHNVFKSYGENENESVPSTSYARVPSKSSEVATRILQHLEKLTPKEKSSESKLVSMREKSPFTLTPSMLSGHALRSMEDVDSSKSLFNVQDDHKLGDRSNATLPGARDCFTQKQEKVEESGRPKVAVAPSDQGHHVTNNDFAMSLKASTPSASATDSTVKISETQPPLKKRAFRMSAQEDYFEHDDDIHCNGLASRPFSEKKGPIEAALTDNKVAPSEESMLLKPSIQQEDQSPPVLITRNSSELSPGAEGGDVGSIVPLPASEETVTASQSAPVSVPAFDKPKEANDPPPLFSFSSKVAEKFASVPAESSKEAELKIESSSSLVLISPSAGSQVKIHELDKSSHLNLFQGGERNGKSDIVPYAASNGSAVSSLPPVVFTPASSNDKSQVFTGNALPFTSSSSSANSVATGSSSSTSSGSIFGLDAAKPSSLAGGPDFKFGTPVGPVGTSVSATSATNNILRTKIEVDPSSGSSLSNNMFGLRSSVGFPTPNSDQGSVFGSAHKSLVSSVGTDTSTQSVSSALFSVNSSSTSFGSQVLNPGNAFGFSLPASTSDNSSALSGPTSSVLKLGAITSSEKTAVSSATTSPGIFSFGFSASSSSTNTNSSSSGVTPPIFGFSGNSSASTATSSSSSAIFTFGGSSSVSSASASAPSSNTTNNTAFGSSWQSPKSSSIFGSQTPSTTSSGFPFAASTAPGVFNNNNSNNSSLPRPPMFSFATASPSMLSSSPSQSQAIFGVGNNDQMNAEDSMAEDHHPVVVPTPIFGSSSSPTPAAAPFTFGSSTQPPNTTTNPFMMFTAGQQNQVAPFQPSGSLEFNAGGGSFSLGSGGGPVDKSARKIVKINRNKNRKK